TIDFGIPGSGVKTISPLSALPAITNQVTIDGTSQPGYSGTPLVELRGPGSSGTAFAGLTIQAAGSTVRGLEIDAFNGTGIAIQASQTVIAGNVVSGNTGDGILITGMGTTGNVVEGNLIGLNAAGSAALGNGNDGVEVDAPASANTIGGTTA